MAIVLNKCVFTALVQLRMMVTSDGYSILARISVFTADGSPRLCLWNINEGEVTTMNKANKWNINEGEVTTMNKANKWLMHFLGMIYTTHISVHTPQINLYELFCTMICDIKFRMENGDLNSNYFRIKTACNCKWTIYTFSIHMKW